MSLSPTQRFVLIQHVNALVQPEFEALVFALEAPQSVIPSGAAAQGNRSSALLQWVEGPSGCGMTALLMMLNQIGPLPSELGGIEGQAQNTQDGALAQQVDAWFQSLNYGRESYEQTGADYWEWIITIPARRGYDRILVRCVAEVAGVAQLEQLRQVFSEQRPDEGWLISNRRVAPAAKKKLEDRDYRDLYCYTLDEVIDQVADFGQYLTWLETEISQKRIDTDYIPLGCSKDEIDPKSHQKIGVSHYGEDEGWIEGYVDQWLADSTKEHLSVLGEFGTGKTWFALRYAWLSLQKYKEAKQKGIVRPRLPLVIPLRDYAKAVSAESLFSEFFFRKHEIPLPSYKSFQQLNRMGKLLLIFDGFDEMAARINQQSMIDNFWELAKVVVPGAKAILTCRTEHFPDAIAGRQLLNAELKASTSNLTGEPPQFEVLELAKFSDEQIGTLLGRKAKAEAVSKVMGNPQLLDLARRPVMVELILEALPEIEQGKPIDMARVYLYAVTRKMERDIKSERTFTSMADKLYFLCELSWEMLSTDRMSLNYRSFPERLQQLFGDRVKEDKELDHWRYDMMGQTMLIRNSEGDYSPAHRSLLEFFVAYKIVASLGAMAEDFTAIARQQSYLAQATLPKSYTWDSYFKRDCHSDGIPRTIAPLAKFDSIQFDHLLTIISKAPLAKAVLDLAHSMLDETTMQERLLPLVHATREKGFEIVGYLGGNIIQLMITQNPYSLIGTDLKNTKLKGVNFAKTYLREVDLQNAHLSEVTFSKVTNSIRTLAFSPVNQYLAIGDFNGSVQIWDTLTGQVILLCLGHSDWVSSVTFSPDGSIVASGSDDHTVKLWSLDSGECLCTLEEHSQWVLSVAFSPDGKLLASGSEDQTIKLWSTASGNCIQTLEGHTDLVWSMVFSSDGKTLASGSRDKTLKLWSTDSGKCIRTLEGHTDSIWSVALSPDGKTLASGSLDQTVKLWAMDEGRCIRTFHGHSRAVLSVAFNPNGKILASGSADETIKLWSMDSGQCLLTLEEHSDFVLSVTFSSDGKTLASGSDDQTVKLWSMDSGKCIYTIESHSHAFLSIALSPDDNILVSGSDDQTVTLWSASSGEGIRSFSDHLSAVRAVTFSPDGKLIASGSNDQTVKLWSVESGDCTTLVGHSGSVRSVAFSPDGKLIASTGNDYTIKLWSTLSGDCINTFRSHLSSVLAVSFSPNGRKLVSGSDDNTLKLWSISSGRCINTLKGHSRSVRSVAFSPDGKTVASGGSDKIVRLWSVDSGKCIRKLLGHTNRVWSIAFSSNGQILASGSDDQTAKLWSVTSGKCVQTFNTSPDRIRTVVISSDDKKLILGSENETIHFYDIQTGDCLNIIDNRVCAGMNITSVMGLTSGQRIALKLMGAIERF